VLKIDKFEIKSIQEVLRNAYFYVGLAVVCIWSLLHFGCGEPFIGAIIFGTFLLLFSFVDLKHFILPDALMLPSFLLGLIVPPLLMGQSWVNTFAGAFLGFGLFFLIAWGFFKIRGYHGLGFGDVKFLGMLGAWVGATSLPPLILISSFVAMPVFILRKLIKGTSTASPLPFGPFLAAGGWLMFLYDIPIWRTILQVRASIIQTILGGS
jgi:leader peptidase (prepilin peptidase)/N-methyltransferase